MAYDRQMLELTALFNILSQPETAQFGLRASYTAGWTGAAAALGVLTTANLTTLYSRFQSIMNVTGLNWCAYSSLTGVKVAALGTDGRYLDNPKTYLPGSPVAGTNVSGAPAQTAMVCTMWSGSHIGKANYGRIYLPHCAPSLNNSSPFITDTARNAIRTAFQSALNSINSDLLTWLGVAVKVRIHGAAGTTKDVAQVGTGRVTDTQRRRRNALDELIGYVAL